MSQKLLPLLALVGSLACRAGFAAEGEEPKPDFPPVETVLKGTTKLQSLDPNGGAPYMILHHNKETDDLFLEIPKGEIGKEFLVATSIAAGGAMTGFQWGDGLLRWEEQGKNLLLIEPEVRYERPASTVQELVAETYPNSIAMVVPIKTKNARGDPIIDMGAVLKSDFAGLGRVLGGNVRADLSRFGKLKVFTDNAEVPVQLMVMKGQGGSRGVVHFSFSRVPSTGYKSRAADDRIGYFMTVQRDWAKKHDEKTNFIRNINRWHLEKRDPSLDLSPPKEPIVFYIEKTVPVPFRRYVKDGILEWNKAFEKCGFIDAVEVRQQTETEFQDLDPEDVNYNFFRWIVSGNAFAMGPSRVNPRTGQILDADIIMDDSFVRYYLAEYEINSGAPTALLPYAENDPLLDRFLLDNPEWRYQSRVPAVAKPFTQTPNLSDELARDGRGFQATANAGGESGCLGHAAYPCQAAQGMTHQINLMRAQVMAQGKGALPLEYLGQMIKEVVMHEVGHTLGLRHNFKASSWKTMAEIVAAKGTDAATVASVMDYNGAIFAPEGAEQANYVTVGLGPYDMWAIRYGYSQVAEPYKSEEEMLKAIAAESAQPGHMYATDEDTSMLGPDPHVNRYDMSSDNIEFARFQTKLTQDLLKGLEAWAVKDGESWSQLRRSFNMLVGEYGRVGMFVGRYVGGQYISRSHKGDVGATLPIEVVPAARQREAVDFICETVFSDATWKFSPELLSKLGAARWSHWDSDEFSDSLEYDLHDRIAAMQNNCLLIIMNGITLSRLYDSPTKVGGEIDVYTVPEHFEKVTRAIWGELGKEPEKGSTYVSSIRRGLQRRHLQALSDLVLTTPGGNIPADINALARLVLRELGTQIEGRMKSESLDAFSKAHLYDSSERIARALAASYQLAR